MAVYIYIYTYIIIFGIIETRKPKLQSKDVENSVNFLFDRDLMDFFMDTTCHSVTSRAVKRKNINSYVFPFENNKSTDKENVGSCVL